MTVSTHSILLRAHNIGLRFGQGPVLANLNMRIQAQECVVILGPSGVGKSTLLRCLAGLATPTEGHIDYQGQPLKSVHPRLAVAFQDPALLPWLTVRENVGFGLNFSRQPTLSKHERAQRVQRALTEVGLAHCPDLYPSELSGGMAQRVALARCLARQPEALLLDEPFGALDAVTRHDMQRLLQRIRKDFQCTVIMITHDIDEALALATRLLVIAGRPANLVAEWELTPTLAADGSQAITAQHQTIKQDILTLLNHYALTQSAP